MSSDGPPILDLFDQDLPESASPPPPEGEDAGAAGTPGAEEEPDRSTASRSTPDREVFTVSEVNRAVRDLLEGALKPVWVSGEVGGWTRARSGHCYFTLKDERAQLRCVMFRSDASRLPTDPDEGMELRVHGRLTLYEARGEYQLTARKVEAAGEDGLWRLAFEKLRRKLEEEGLLAPERKRALPRHPRAVGVVTSTTGAALRDVLSVVRRRAPWTHVVVRGTRVQGEGAAVEIAEAIRALGASGRVDVLVVGRGGGSVEDLWAFNEEPVARAIAACPVPVVSAVGHEVDVTISDLVADLRAPTPSAAAEAVVQDGAALLKGLRALQGRLGRALRNTVRIRLERLARGRRRLLREVRYGVERSRKRTFDLSGRLETAMEACVRDRRARLRVVSGRLDALSPLATLRRGYAVPLTAEGRVLRSPEDFEPGLSFELRLAEGRVRAETVSVDSDLGRDGAGGASAGGVST